MNKELENSNVNEAQEIKLAENAFRELKPGEEYKPIMSSDINPREATPWSVIWGLVMVIIFSAATAYLGLKVGQVFEAAIPIAIIAVGISGAAKRKGALGENVIIQSIGACSGNVVAGAIFTLPALYILQAKYPDISVDFAKVFLASFLGGALGILFLIPFRKYFVKEMHGKYPFPEATATTQVLVSGQKGGGSLTLLLKSGIIGGLYDFIVATFGLWNENFTSRVCSLGETVADKAKFVFKINTGAAVLGMGYIVGLKYATIICAGSVIVWWVIVPLISLIFPELIVANGVSAASASPEQIFSYARSIGIGAIAMAGIIGIIKSRKIIVSAVSLAGREMKKKGEESKETVRTQRDLPMKFIVVGTIITLLIIFLFFWFGAMQGNIMYAIAGILLVAVIAFLFTTVAANAIAIVGSNPVSGMTLMALILSSIIMVSVGLKGTGGIVASLLMGGVICTALSMAGSFVTDLKIGYWLGTTPAKQESFKFLGTLVAAVTVGGVMIVLNKTYGFTGDALAAPQAHAMAAVIEPLMNGGSAPWLLYGIGCLIAIVLTACNVSALAFALGMFIPLELNLPLLVGGLVSWYVKNRTNDEKLRNAYNERGTLIASGFIAGGALMGVVSAALRFGGINLVLDSWLANPMSELVSLVAYVALVAVFVKMSVVKPKNFGL
ncbi:MAG: oligopeptide transporter, OPT family [Prevotellaceae bacterium]|nr:oligopeptide transporter, OPT family [Prevotellaceae bacterium]